MYLLLAILAAKNAQLQILRFVVSVRKDFTLQRAATALLALFKIIVLLALLQTLPFVPAVLQGFS